MVFHLFPSSDTLGEKGRGLGGGVTEPPAERKKNVNPPHGPTEARQSEQAVDRGAQQRGRTD